MADICTILWQEQKRKTSNKFIEKMMQKIDSSHGRYIYSKRLGIVESVFAYITRTLEMDKFNVRGKRKVNIQWKLFCLVHDLKKLTILPLVLINLLGFKLEILPKKGLENLKITKRPKGL